MCNGIYEDTEPKDGYLFRYSSYSSYNENSQVRYREQPCGKEPTDDGNELLQHLFLGPQPGAAAAHALTQAMDIPTVPYPKYLLGKT